MAGIVAGYNMKILVRSLLNKIIPLSLTAYTYKTTNLKGELWYMVKLNRQLLQKFTTKQAALDYINKFYQVI